MTRARLIATSLVAAVIASLTLTACDPTGTAPLRCAATEHRDGDTCVADVTECTAMQDPDQDNCVVVERECTATEIEENNRCVPDGPNQCPNDELDGCYKQYQMGRFYQYVLTATAENFLAATYPTMSPPRDYVYIAHGDTEPTACAGGDADGEAFFYCPTDRTVYLGQDALWYFYDLDDIAAILGFMHEIGHHIQTAIGVPAPERQGTTSEQVRLLTIKHENQADCLAGSWLKYAKDKGLLTGDDLLGVTDLIDEIGSKEGADRDHGTDAERLAALNLGLKNGVVGCNNFYPQYPVGKTTS